MQECFPQPDQDTAFTKQQILTGCTMSLYICVYKLYIKLQSYNNFNFTGESNSNSNSNIKGGFNV